MKGINDNHDIDQLWKYICQIYGLFNAQAVFALIDQYLSKSRPEYVKFALDTLEGIMKASFTFEREEYAQFKQFIVDKVLPKVYCHDSESNKSWDHFVTRMFARKDMRRHMYVYESLCDQDLFASLSPFFQTFFVTVASIVADYNLKQPEISQQLLCFAEKNLDSQYQLVRVSMGE